MGNNVSFNLYDAEKHTTKKMSCLNDESSRCSRVNWYLVAGVATVFLIGGACAGVITLPTTSDSGLVTRPAVIGKGGIPPLLDFENSTERALAHIMSSDKCGSGFFEVVEHNGEFITCPQATEPTEIAWAGDVLPLDKTQVEKVQMGWLEGVFSPPRPEEMSSTRSEA